MTRKETIIATILLIIFGTSMHFVHHVPFFNHFLGYIFPVTESVMAHMCCCATPLATVDSAHRAGYHHHWRSDLPCPRLDHLRRFRII